jgi:intracellular septation protein A
MNSTLTLWWSLLWRLTLAIVVLSYVIEWAVRLAFSLDATWFKLQPSIFWCALAVIFWVVSAASTRFFASVVWGERLILSPKQWLVIARVLALFFLALAVLNIVIANLASTDRWVYFKLFVPYPLFMVFLGALAARVRRLRDAA